MDEATRPSGTDADANAAGDLGDGGLGRSAEPAAVAIAVPTRDAADDEDEVEDHRPRLVRFALGDRELLVDVAGVLEVLVAGPITRLPGAAPAIAGVTSVRGRIVAVVDASAALDTSAPATRDHFLVIATPGGPVALVVDRVDAVVAADLDPVTASGGDSPAVALVTATATVDGRTIAVIDPLAVVEAAIGSPDSAVADPTGAP